jgi:hypothetical protein
MGKWSWSEESGLALRLAEVAASASLAPAIVAEVLAASPRRGPLPVTRGERTTISHVPVEGATLALIEAEHGPVTWYTFRRRWFVARDAAGEIVAILRLPTGYALADTVMVELDGSAWACAQTFAVRFTPTASADEAVQAAVRSSRPRAGSITDKLSKMMEGWPSWLVVPAVRAGDVMRVGRLEVEAEDVDIVTRYCGAVQWRAKDVAVAVRLGVLVGQVVGVVVPRRKR